MVSSRTRSRFKKRKRTLASELCFLSILNNVQIQDDIEFPEIDELIEGQTEFLKKQDAINNKSTNG